MRRTRDLLLVEGSMEKRPVSKGEGLDLRRSVGEVNNMGEGWGTESKQRPKSKEMDRSQSNIQSVKQRSIQPSIFLRARKYWGLSFLGRHSITKPCPQTLFL
jgi:hypothetical protein